MKPTLLAIALFIATNALAVRLEVPKGSAPAAVDTPRKAEKLREARAVFTLPDGSLWVAHPAPAKREPNAIAVTRFDPDGSAAAFAVSDWLPKGSIPRGWCGQVYGVTQLSDGRIAVSGGWTDGAESHNAIFTLRRREDGRYDTDRVVKLPGVGEIAGTAGNGIVAVTDDASRRDHGAILTAIDAEGHRIAVLAGNKTEALTAVQAAQNTANAKLQRVGEKWFAFYNPAAEEVYIFEVVVGRREATIMGVAVIFIGDDAELASLRVIGIEVADDRDVIVVRTGRYRGRLATHLTVYDHIGRVKETKTLDEAWNHVIREKGKLHGVVNRGDVLLDTMTLAREK
jgi:hypothetical protein